MPEYFFTCGWGYGFPYDHNQYICDDFGNSQVVNGNNPLLVYPRGDYINGE